MKFKVFNEFNDELEQIWRDFEYESLSTPFQSYHWQKYWNEKVRSNRYDINLCIVVCFKDEKTIAIFPLGIKKIIFLKVLTFLGEQEADYNAPLLSISLTSDDIRIAWKEILNIIPTFDVIYFRNVPELIKDYDNLLIKESSYKKIGNAFSIKLPNVFEEYSKTLSKSMLKDNKRMIRRLDEIGEVKFNVIDELKDFKQAIETLIAQKEERYKQSGARNIFNDKVIKNFYKNIYELLDKSYFKINLSTLTLDEEILAAHLGIHYKNEYYYLMPTFNHNPKWKKFSLGRIHLEKLINWSIDNNIKKFDFTIGSEGYKGIWCNNDMEIYRYLKSNTIRGHIFYIYIYFIELVKSNPFLKSIALKLLSINYIWKRK